MKRVLIAEDDCNLQYVFSEALSMHDFDVQIARDGQEALDRLDTQSPDVLVLDINIPRVSGLDVLTYIHQRPELQDVKIIVVTGSARAANAPQIEYADLMLMKPVSLRELASYAEELVAIN